MPLTPAGSFGGHQRAVLAVAWAPGGFVVSGSEDGDLRAWTWDAGTNTAAEVPLFHDRYPDLAGPDQTDLLDRGSAFSTSVGAVP